MRKNEQFLNFAVLSCVVVSIAVTYSAGMQDPYYTADDYVFLSQVTRYGLVKSLVIPFKDHFVPLYRLLMGGLHVAFEQAMPMRAVILGFHILTSCLIFLIVRTHTKSLALSVISSVTFGLSKQASDCVIWCLSGYFGMSLCFVLLMSVCFEKFLRMQDNLEAEPSTLLPTHVLQTRMQAMKYYYFGLASFAIALGLFTNALFGGAIIWFFLYARLISAKRLKLTLRDHAVVVADFVSIVIVYLSLRSYFNEKWFLIQDSFFLKASSAPELPFSQKVSIIKNLPSEFYLIAVRWMTPYFPQRYFLIIACFAVLLAKEAVFRTRQISIILMWMSFAFVTLAAPLVGRMFLIQQLFGSVLSVFALWYFCYPFAGLSIVLGLVLKPPPFMERIFIKATARVQMAMVALVAALLLALNFNQAKGIANAAIISSNENLKFHKVLEQYRKSMDLFLNSPTFSAGKEFYFLDAPAADARLYPAGWSVKQSNIFHLYFPSMKNVHFSDQKMSYELYLWTPQGVFQERSAAGER